MAEGISEENAERALIVRGLQRTVDGRQLMPKLSLTVRPSGIVFLVGPSGVGKSTALRLIAGLDQPDSTAELSIKLAGRAQSDVGLPEWRSAVMLVQQRPISLPGSPADLFRRTADFRVRSGRLPKLSVERDYYPSCFSLGLSEDRIKEEWSTLSGGEAQRAALAMALALRPDALLLDEVTSALDPDATRVVEKVIVDHCREHGTIVLWISHDSEQPPRVEQLAPSIPDLIDFQALMDEDNV